ncbi:GAF domain-containing protein [Pseudomonas entomophila]|uniref:GAF domain-containing protein n=2 Tax=Pseudomonas entomophila TaxID=312306 RepID=Q1ID10_PSEE4|nr:GAF domain-containing protein [Pseudomonas entomophila]WMW04742.1 GAF domain-containing protein [Pseudomonas entomophila]CAK14451.1 hypothetical protein; putative membrane protein [Pseudomonas entomophila L48]
MKDNQVFRYLVSLLSGVYAVAAAIFHKLCKFLASGVGAFLVALSGVAGAALVSIYSSTIVKQIDYVLFSGEETSLDELTVASAVSLAAVILIMLREFGLAESARRRERQLDLQHAQMGEQLTSMPPKSFLSLYAEAVKNTGLLRSISKVQLKERKADGEVLIKRMRVIMNTILSLARSWDGVSRENQAIVYRSNFMIALTSSSLKKGGSGEGGIPDILKTSKFFLHDQNYSSLIERCDGVLLLVDNQLSTSSLVADDGPDQDIQPICFPYSLRRPGVRASMANHPNIPGAPEAAASGSAQYLGQTGRIIQGWLESVDDTNPHITRDYKDRVGSYYLNRDEAQSLLAIPIKYDDRLLGVLNIYRNDSRILFNENRSDQFVTLLEPICYQLAKMLTLIVSESSGKEEAK